MNWINEIKDYIPVNEQEERDKEFILYAIENFDDLLTRNNPICHMTSSCYIINKTHDKVLFIYHKIYKSWAWTGGHADGDDDFLHVALKEGTEETGIKEFKVLNNKTISLDVLPVPGHIKNGKFVSPHLHLNVTYLLEADENDSLILNEEETKGVKWIPLDEIDKYSTEPDMIVVYNKLNEYIKNNTH